MAGIIFSKGSGLNDSIYGKSQEPIRAVIEKNVEAFEQQSQIKNVFFMDSTRNYAEKYTQETSLGNFEDVGENGAYPKTSMQEGYAKVLEPTTWKSSFEVTQEMVEDAKYGKIKSRANIFATSFNRTREEFAAGLLAGGVAEKPPLAGANTPPPRRTARRCFPRRTRPSRAARAPSATPFRGPFPPMCWIKCRIPCRASQTTTAIC